MKVMKVESLQFFMLLTDNILMTLNFSNKETPKNKVQGCVKVLNFNFFKKSQTQHLTALVPVLQFSVLPMNPRESSFKLISRIYETA